MTRNNKTLAPVLAALKRTLPALGLAVATLLPGACKKPLVQHDTTYTWNVDNWHTPTLGANAAASADSAEVRYVFLESDGSSMHGSPTYELLESLGRVINYVAPENRNKIRGAGTLNEIYINDNEALADSVKLANMGFKFGKVRYAQGYNYIR